MPGIDQHDLEPGILKEVVERLPVVTGRLHHRTGDLLGDQMLTQGQDLIGGRAPRRDRLGRLAATSASNPDTDLGVLLGDIQASTPAMHLSLIHISEPTRRTPISYAVFCLKKKKKISKKKKHNKEKQ